MMPRQGAHASGRGPGGARRAGAAAGPGRHVAGPRALGRRRAAAAKAAGAGAFPPAQARAGAARRRGRRPSAAEVGRRRAPLAPAVTLGDWDGDGDQKGQERRAGAGAGGEAGSGAAGAAAAVWRQVVAILCATMLLCNMVRNVLSVLSVPLMAELGVGLEGWGVVQSSFL